VYVQVNLNTKRT